MGWKLFFLGMRMGVPVVFGYVPVGIAFGVSALEVGYTPTEAVLMSVLVYSGAGQILGLAMTAQGAGLLAIAIGTFLINFRYFIMSMCVFRRLPNERLSLRLWLSFYITDETFAIFTTAEERIARLPLILGLVALTYLSWILGAWLGVEAHALLPGSVTLALGIALYALFIALVAPGCRGNWRIFLLVLLTAVLNTGLSRWLDLSWAVVISTLSAAALGGLFIGDGEGGKDRKVPGRQAGEGQ
ncbi:MAG: AzlC family ABC transporter permease [Succinivibrionaceae bacterium]|nr:AzlC family ABC transporter permease [Succinivibrionaceae bacterium]